MSGRLARSAVLALCAVLLWFAVDWSEAARLLRQADWRCLLGAVALLTLQTALSAERWRITAGQLGLRFEYLFALREYYLSQVMNQSFPGGVLGDANRAARTRDLAGLLPSVQAVIFERFAGQLGLLTVLLLSAVMGGWVPVWAGFLVLLLAVMALWGLAPRLVQSTNPVARFLSAFARSVVGRTVWLRQALLSIATAVCNITSFALCAAAIGTAFDVFAAGVLFPLILFAMVVPISIGGWGVREGAAAGLFPLWGASPEAGLAASVAFGLMILVSVAPAFLIGWSKHTGQPGTDRDLP